jgi:hypothetical protein
MVTSDHLLQALPASIVDSLTSYNVLPSTLTPAELLHPVLNQYLETLMKVPLPPSQTKSSAEGCELCEREHIPLTYHHLIPRSTHVKALARKWHTKDQLNNVAWLCRACHTFVHGLASNEVLAKELYTVELIEDREETGRWVGWIGRIRWRKR